MEGRAGVAIGDDDLHSAGAVDDGPDAALILIPAQHLCNETTASLSRHIEALRVGALHIGARIYPSMCKIGLYMSKNFLDNLAAARLDLRSTGSHPTLWNTRPSR